jgi:hypothetical protein
LRRRVTDLLADSGLTTAWPALNRQDEAAGGDDRAR